jgi:hypothetical protein
MSRWEKTVFLSDSHPRSFQCQSSNHKRHPDEIEGRVSFVVVVGGGGVFSFSPRK